MIYQAFSVPSPKSMAAKAMTAYAMAIVAMANKNMARYEERQGAEANTLLVSPDAPAEVEEWFGEAMTVVRHKMPSGMFGVTRR